MKLKQLLCLALFLAYSALGLARSIETELSQIILERVHFNQTPLSEAAQLLFQLLNRQEPHTCINIVVIDPENKNPQITLSMSNVKLEQALEFTAKAAGFYYDLENGIITLRPGNQSQGFLKTAFFPLSRAAIAQMTYPLLKPVADNIESALAEEKALKAFFGRTGVPFGSLEAPQAQLAFDGTQLIVTHTQANLDKIQAILKHYEQAWQVNIEAKFIEVQEGVLEELGFRWNAFSNTLPQSKFVNTHDAGNLQLTAMNSTFNPSNKHTDSGKVIFRGETPISVSNKAPWIPNALNLGAGVAPFASLLTSVDNWKINMVIDALEQHTGSDLMSAPKLTVLSGKTANIKVAQTMRYPQAYGDIQSGVGNAGIHGTTSAAGVTITAGTPQNFTEKNVGVEMRVTPFVEEGGRINLRLEPTVTEFEGFVEYGGRSLAIAGNNTVVHVPSGFFQPIFSVRSIETELTIANGSTVILGGLAREEAKECYHKVPILGDIPGLGKLFRSRGESRQKRNLLIFVKATLVDAYGNPLSIPEAPTEPEWQAIARS